MTWKRFGGGIVALHRGELALDRRADDDARRSRATAGREVDLREVTTEA